ncbi:hypothetical protein SO802_033672 [Lithocarpus litseifolius]|uniref:Uncharacterized protein n=1 Tax=Lithocarpus litseifolius TaxID=425828 RepID=A0AAW2BEB8_9ROSI
MVNFSHRRIKEKEGRHIAAMDAFNVAEKKIQELTIKLNEANRDKKSAEATLQGDERTYCLQVWNEALNQAEVEASSTLRRVENATTVSKKANEDKGSPTKIPRSSPIPPKEAEQAKATKKTKDTSKEVVPETPHPLKIVLATLPMLAKEDSKSKGQASTAAKTAKSTKATGRENPPLKIN